MDKNIDNEIAECGARRIIVPLSIAQSKRSIIRSLRIDGFNSCCSLQNTEKEDPLLNVVCLERKDRETPKPLTYSTTKIDSVNFAIALPRK